MVSNAKNLLLRNFKFVCECLTDRDISSGSLDSCVRRQWFPKSLLDINQSSIDDMQQHDIHNDRRHYQEIFGELTCCKIFCFLSTTGLDFFHVFSLPFNHLLTLNYLSWSSFSYQYFMFKRRALLSFQGICRLKMIIIKITNNCSA